MLRNILERCHAKKSLLKRCMFSCNVAMDLEYRFATTYSLLCLHVWLILVRLRAESKDGKDLAQMMYENFQEDVELRVRAEGVKVQLFEAHPSTPSDTIIVSSASTNLECFAGY